MKLKILVVHHHVHPHFGGAKQDVHEFEMSEFIQAEAVYNGLKETDINGYSHTTINIVNKF